MPMLSLSMAIIGLTGPLASGKGYVAEILQKRGYKYFSLSDEVRKEASRRNLPHDRDILQDVGDLLRAEFGNEVLAQRVAASIAEVSRETELGDIVIDGIRNPGEISWLQQNLGIKVIGVTADPEIRYARVVARARTADVISREAFDRAEQRDRGIGQTDSGNRVDACLDLADILIENNASQEELLPRLEHGLVHLEARNISHPEY